MRMSGASYVALVPNRDSLMGGLATVLFPYMIWYEILGQVFSDLNKWGAGRLAEQLSLPTPANGQLCLRNWLENGGARRFFGQSWEPARLIIRDGYSFP